MFSFFKKKLPPNTQTLTLKIIGMHCTSCSLNIDSLLEETKGIVESNTSYAKSITKIIYDPTIITTSSIKNLIAKLGYESQ